MASDTPTRPALVLAPSGRYCTGEEAIRITVLNADSDTSLNIGGRFIDRDTGRVISISARHVPNTDRTPSTIDIPLQEGWLEAVTVIAGAGSPPFAHAVARIDLIRGGRGGGADVLETLSAGAVTGNTRLAWPGSGVSASIAGPGALRALAGTNPAANAELAETVPAGARWRLRSLLASLVTDANAANREVALLIDDGATVYFATTPGANHAASLTRRYCASPAGVRGIGAAANEIAIAIPDLVLPAGHRIRTLTTNLQAGDDWGAPQLCVEEWLEAQ